ncbi:MAG: hypothetical protein JWL73_3231 [Actinomycetia bacterium]|nr:hypothetical protein [Actinomycetes bacterium]
MARVQRWSDRELTVSFLERQLLLERMPMPAARAVQRLGALQAQYSPSPYVALHARVAGFRVEDLESALRRRTVVKSTLMRGTLHLVSGADYAAFASAWARQWFPAVSNRHPDLKPREPEIAAALAKFTSEPRTTDEIRAAIDDLSGLTIGGSDRLDYARALVPLVHVPPSGFWRFHGKASLRRWPEPPVPEPVATALLVRRYLRAFGPATRKDIAAFTYLPYKVLDPALALLEPLRRVTDEQGRDLLDLPGVPRVREDVEPPVRFLARWDAALISHADRTRILPSGFHEHIVQSVNGQVLPAYLVDGRVAGLWTEEQVDGAAVLRLHPLGSGAPARFPSDLEPEGLRLLELLAPDATDRRVEVSPGVPADG